MYGNLGNQDTLVCWIKIKCKHLLALWIEYPTTRDMSLFLLQISNSNSSWLIMVTDNKVPIEGNIWLSIICEIDHPIDFWYNIGILVLFSNLSRQWCWILYSSLRLRAPLETNVLHWLRAPSETDILHWLMHCWISSMELRIEKGNKKIVVSFSLSEFADCLPLKFIVQVHQFGTVCRMVVCYPYLLEYNRIDFQWSTTGVLRHDSS